jgi:hypothetical protein
MASAAQEREALRLVIESRVPQSTPSLGTNGRTRAMSVTDPASSWPTRTESRRGGRGHRGGLSRRRYRRSRDVSKTRPCECNLCRPNRLSEFDDGAVGGRRAQGPSWGTQRTGPPTFGRPGRIGTTLRRDRMAASLVSPRKGLPERVTLGVKPLFNPVRAVDREDESVRGVTYSASAAGGIEGFPVHQGA